MDLLGRSRILSALLFFSAILCADPFIPVDASLADDPAVEHMLKPYRDQLSARMDLELVVTQDPLAKAKPTARLNNLIADSLLWKAQEIWGDTVDIAVSNYGGIRTSVGAGSITVGEVFEISPFDNTIVLLTLTGSDVVELAHQIARTGGEPVAGMSFKITEEQRAAEILVGEAAPDPEQLYTVATINYLADGNGSLSILWGRTDEAPKAVCPRESMIEYLQSLGSRGVQLSRAFDPRIVSEESHE